MKKTALFIIALFPVSLYSQVETHYYQKEDTIHSEFMKIKGLGSSNVVKMPKFDLQELIEEDQRMESNNLPYRFGKPLKSQGQVFDSFEDQSPVPPIFPWIFFLDGK